MRTTLLTGRFLNELIEHGEYRFEPESRTAQVGTLLWWGADHRFVFRANGNLWCAWVAGAVNDIDEYEFEFLT